MNPMFNLSYSITALHVYYGTKSVMFQGYNWMRTQNQFLKEIVESSIHYL